MTTKLCPNCDSYVRGAAHNCPSCGYDLEWTPPMKDRSDSEDIRRFIRNLGNPTSLNSGEKESSSRPAQRNTRQQSAEIGKPTSSTVDLVLRAHDFSRDGICARCGCSRDAISHFKWLCKSESVQGNNHLSTTASSGAAQDPKMRRRIKELEAEVAWLRSIIEGFLQTYLTPPAK
jgi:hypothetical protein